jgi:hypothetical protein
MRSSCAFDGRLLIVEGGQLSPCCTRSSRAFFLGSASDASSEPTVQVCNDSYRHAAILTHINGIGLQLLRQVPQQAPNIKFNTLVATPLDPLNRLLQSKYVRVSKPACGQSFQVKEARNHNLPSFMKQMLIKVITLFGIAEIHQLQRLHTNSSSFSDVLGPEICVRHSHLAICLVIHGRFTREHTSNSSSSHVFQQLPASPWF